MSVPQKIIDDISNLIFQYTGISQTPTAKGWHVCKCQLCNDYKVRAGFKFETYKIIYHCFDCAQGCVLDLETQDNKCFLSKKFKYLLTVNNIPDDKIKLISLNLLRLNENSVISESEFTPIVIEPDKIVLPNHFTVLQKTKHTDIWANIAKQYLLNRKINWQEYDFYISNNEDSKWYKRLIIPYFKGDNIIFYTGRDLTNHAKLKYLHCSTVKEGTILYGYNNLELLAYDDPILITEGFFDAYAIDGVALNQNSISEQQINYLKRYRQHKIVIQDRFGDGWKLSERVLKLNWSISIPDIGTCKDVNEAIIKYGKLHVIKSIMNNIKSGIAAETMVKLSKNKDIKLQLEKNYYKNI